METARRFRKPPQRKRQWRASWIREAISPSAYIVADIDFAGPVSRTLQPTRYHPAVHHRRDRLDAADLVFRATEVIAVDHHQVGELAWLDGAACLLAELKKRRP